MAKIKVEIITERKIIIVQPGMLFASPDRIEVDVCVKCGAVVFDPIQHDSWHRIAARAEVAGDHASRAGTAGDSGFGADVMPDRARSIPSAVADRS